MNGNGPPLIARLLYAPKRFKRNIVQAGSVFRRRGRAGKSGTLNRRRGWSVEICALVGVLAVALTAFYLDEASIEFRKAVPETVTRVFRSVTDVGKSDWILIPTGLICLFALCLDWRKFPPSLKAAMSSLLIYVGYVFATVAASGVFVILMKIIFGRARPKFFDQVGAFDFSPFTIDAGYASFPSGHATTVFAMVGAAFFLFPRFRMLFLAIGVWSAVSRIFVVAHYPSDVAAGMMIGAAFSYAIARMLAVRRLGFRLDEDGGIVPTHIGWPLVAVRKLVHIARHQSSNS